MWKTLPVEPGITRAAGTYVKESLFSTYGVAAGKGDEPFHVEVKGRRDWTPRGPLTTPDDLFDLASLTKPLATGSLLALAVGKGKVALDSKVERYLPSSRGTAWAQVQLWQLASHCSGASAIPTGGIEQLYGELLKKRLAGDVTSVEPIRELESALTKALFAQEPANSPNQTLYSDLGFWILGLVLEEVWGASLEQAFLEQIARPLGLTDELTFFRWKPSTVTSGHPFSRGPSKGRAVVSTMECPRRDRTLTGEVHDPLCWSLGGVAGHAGLFGTLYGVYRLTSEWLSAFRGKDSLFHSGTVTKFWTRQRLPRDTTWALCWDTPSAHGSTAGDRWSRSGVGHLGFTGTSIWVDLKEDLIGVVLSNAAHWPGDPKRARINPMRRSVYDAIAVAGKSMNAGGARGAAAFGTKT